MIENIIGTSDRVPSGPRGFVRDLRLRRACEDAGARVTDRLAFPKARAAQLANFEAGDASRR